MIEEYKKKRRESGGRSKNLRIQKRNIRIKGRALSLVGETSPKIKILSSKRKKLRRFEESGEEEEKEEEEEEDDSVGKGNPHRSEKYGFYLENVRWEGGLDNCVINYSFYPAGPCRFGEGQQPLPTLPTEHLGDRDLRPPR